MAPNSADNKVILIDGDCLICNKFAQFVINKDRGDFVFGPQSTNKGKKILDRYNLEVGESVVLVKENSAYTKSDAIIEIFSDLRGIWKHIKYASAIPKPLRDSLYDLFSRHRHLLFGRTSKCIIDYNKHRSF